MYVSLHAYNRVHGDEYWYLLLLEITLTFNKNRSLKTIILLEPLACEMLPLHLVNGEFRERSFIQDL